MSFFSQTYVALRGPAGTTQTADDAIRKLTDRLSQATMLPDRRAAVLSLKGLSRDWKQQVGEAAMGGLIEVLLNDADVDDESAKAVLETFLALCDTETAAQPGLQHIDYFLANPVATHKLFDLLSSQSFYSHYGSLQLLSLLLGGRRSVVQRYFITAPEGAGTTGILNSLQHKRDIIRNEALVVLTSLVSQNVEIQKILAFAGAFDSLLSIITTEGGIEGGVTVQDSLSVLEHLLRLNVSNQTYFRETHLQSFMMLLQFPAELTLESDYATPQEFALQFWNDQKAANVGFIVSILSAFSKGPDSMSSAIQRLLVETALASNAPTSIKIQAIRGLPSNPTSQLATLVLTPYAPVPNSNGEEWDRLEHTSALSALVDLVLDGEYPNLGNESETRTALGLELRTAAASMFETFVRRDDVREAVLKGMNLNDPDSHPPRASVQILTALTSPPPQPMDFQFASRTHFACLLAASLVSQSQSAKAIARGIIPASSSAQEAAPPSGHQRSDSQVLFVPADVDLEKIALKEAEELEAKKLKKEYGNGNASDSEGDETLSLMQILTEYTSLGFVIRSKMQDPPHGEPPGEERDWDRLLTGYLTLLVRWLWDDPESVSHFLENRGLDVLVEPINQPFGVDPVVKGLCAFLLGECYEFNREPGSVTRQTIYQIIGRLGSEAIIGAAAKVRTDDRFRELTPESTVTVLPAPGSQSAASPSAQASPHANGEVWFDWGFVEFWKTNFYAIQRCLSLDPETIHAAEASSGLNENAALVASLKEKLNIQAAEIEQLRSKLEAASKQNEEQKDSLQDRISQLSNELAEAQEKRREAEKEQEDLLVFLDEMSTKRKRDKVRLRELGDEVSEDEEAGEDEEDGEDGE